MHDLYDIVESNGKPAHAGDPRAGFGGEAPEGGQGHPQGVQTLRRDADRRDEQAVRLLPRLEQAQASVQPRVL